MGEVMTFRKLEERSRAFAAYLRQGLGLKRAIASRYDAEPAAISGRTVSQLRAGMIVVNVNPCTRLASWNISSTIAARGDCHRLTFATRWKKSTTKRLCNA
ncbi:hypothetical protein ACNKHK_09020 [Shigella flexneri]